MLVSLNTQDLVLLQNALETQILDLTAVKMTNVEAFRADRYLMLKQKIEFFITESQNNK